MFWFQKYRVDMYCANSQRHGLVPQLPLGTKLARMPVARGYPQALRQCEWDETLERVRNFVNESPRP